MLPVINITLPFFLIIFLGYSLKRLSFIDAEKTSFLSRFSFFILMPIMMFSNLHSSVSHEIWNVDFIVRYELITIFIFILAIPLGRLIKLERNSTGLLGLNMAYPNYGYIGLPMCLVAFGSKASMPLALILFADTIVLLVSTACLTFFFSDKSSASAVSKKKITGVILNPLIISVFLGVLFGINDISLYKPIADLTTMIAAAAAPVALIALGASLSFKNIAQNTKVFSTVSCNKLFLHPVLIGLVFIMWPEKDPIWMQTAVLCSCLPVAVNVFVLASHYNTMENESATNIVLTTVLSIVTIPLTLFIILNYLGI